MRVGVATGGTRNILQMCLWELDHIFSPTCIPSHALIPKNVKHKSCLFYTRFVFCGLAQIIIIYVSISARYASFITILYTANNYTLNKLRVRKKEKKEESYFSKTTNSIEIRPFWWQKRCLVSEWMLPLKGYPSRHNGRAFSLGLCAFSSGRA